MKVVAFQNEVVARKCMYAIDRRRSDKETQNVGQGPWVEEPELRHIYDWDHIEIKPMNDGRLAIILRSDETAARLANLKDTILEKLPKDRTTVEKAINSVTIEDVLDTVFDIPFEIAGIRIK